LEAVATLKLNIAELHQSKTSLYPVNALNSSELHQSKTTSLYPAITAIVIRCPVILIRLHKPFSTSGRQQKGKVGGGSNSGGRSDVGDSKTGRDSTGGTIACPCCGHQCSKTEIFMSQYLY